MVVRSAAFLDEANGQGISPLIFLSLRMIYDLGMGFNSRRSAVGRRR